MGKKADALKLEITRLNEVEDILVDGLVHAYGVMTPAAKKKFNQTASPEVMLVLEAALAQPSHGDKEE